MSVATWCHSLFMGDLPAHARWAYIYFAMALGTALGSHTFMMSLKAHIFADVIGVQHAPVARCFVVVVLVPVLIFYNILVSALQPGNTLVSVVLSIYAVLYSVIAWFVFLSGSHIHPWVAWLLYYATETKGVVLVSMIWSVIADVSTPEFSKRAYPFCIFAMQIGGIAGSFVSIRAQCFGQVGLLLLQVGTFFLMAIFGFRACSLMRSDVGEDSESVPLLSNGAAAGMLSGVATEGRAPNDVETSVQERGKAVKSTSEGDTSVLRKGVEGLWLLLSRPYVFMIFWVSYANLMPRTVLDYENMVAITTEYSDMAGRMRAFGSVTLYANTGTCVLALLGTRPLVEHFGVGGMLYVLPVTIFCCVASISFSQSVASTSLALVVVSIMAYGINSPCKEMLFVRTSREIKYKAKSWSEMWGNHFMKLMGSQLNLWLNTPDPSCKLNCFNAASTLMFVGAWVILWIVIVFNIARTHDTLEREDQIVS